jgi:hypothetical protein
MWKFDGYMTNRWAKDRSEHRASRGSRFGGSSFLDDLSDATSAAFLRNTKWADGAAAAITHPLDYLIDQPREVTGQVDWRTQPIPQQPIPRFYSTGSNTANLALKVARAIAGYGSQDKRVRALIMQWQKSRGGLNADGIYGPISATALRVDTGISVPPAYYTRRAPSPEALAADSLV